MGDVMKPEDVGRCLSCGGVNSYYIVVPTANDYPTYADSIDGNRTILEAKTCCTKCGHENYWEHGFFKYAPPTKKETGMIGRPSTEECGAKSPDTILESPMEREIKNLKEENERLHQEVASVKSEIQYYRRLEATINRAKGDDWLFECARRIENGFKYL